MCTQRPGKKQANLHANVVSRWQIFQEASGEPAAMIQKDGGEPAAMMQKAGGDPNANGKKELVSRLQKENFAAASPIPFCNLQSVHHQPFASLQPAHL